jgi:cobalt-zinc-cadmium efflux system outer membrane protein
VVDPESDGPGADHPLLEAGQARLQLAQARLALAQTEGREAPELSLGLTRERGAALEPWQNSARVALRWPLGDDSRQRPRQRAAEAEVAEAALALDQSRRQQAAAMATARTELQEARRMAALQQERSALAAEALDWTRQAFLAGQFDLPTLLRAQAEAASARAQAQRARLEADRAVSRLLQTLGWTP